MASLILSGDKLLHFGGKLAYSDKPCECCSEPCGTEAASGGDGTTVTSYSMPNKAGMVTFRYDSVTVPDRYVVEGDGQIYIDTGDVSGNGTLTFCKPEGVRKVKVTVTGPQGTLWGYDIGCPQEDCTPSLRSTRSSGAGSELTRILGNFWIRYTPGCKCEERAARMDEMGPEWCRQNIELISKWLKEEAEARGLPYVDWLGHQVILQAIAAAEAKALLTGGSTPT